MKRTTWNIYALIDPRTREMKYVGKSFSLKTRFNQHRLSKGKSAKSVWISELKSQGLEPQICILEQGEGDSNVAEIKWIQKLRAEGHVLTNATKGGDQWRLQSNGLSGLRADFRVEAELKEAVKQFASQYGMNETWGWQILVLRGLGDRASEKLRHKYRRFLSGIMD